MQSKKKVIGAALATLLLIAITYLYVSCGNILFRFNQKDFGESSWTASTYQERYRYVSSLITQLKAKPVSRQELARLLGEPSHSSERFVRYVVQRFDGWCICGLYGKRILLLEYGSDGVLVNAQSLLD
jgi:hypothetical protein